MSEGNMNDVFQAAAGFLPEGWEIEISVEHGGASVALFNDEGDLVPVSEQGDNTEEDVKLAIEEARKLAGLGKKPAQWWMRHLPECGTQFRGCHLKKCPVHLYQLLGVWQDEWKEPWS